MNQYKYAGPTESDGVFDQLNNVAIAFNGKGWAEFQEYISQDGLVDPWKTDEEILEAALAEKLLELRSEKNNRVDSAVGSSDPRKKDKVISRSVKLLRREMKGITTAEEEAELNALEVLDDYLDALDNDLGIAEAWLEDPARTLEQIQGYDVVTDPGWSIL